jgi:hypothetical protein
MLIFFWLPNKRVLTVNSIHRNTNNVIHLKNGAPKSVCLLLVTNVKVKIKFTLEESTKLQKGSRGIARLFT